MDKLTGQLATEFTPADRVETRDVAIFPERYHAWAAAHGYPVLNAQSPYPFSPELTLDSPIDGGEVTGVVPVAGRVHIPEPLVWRLEYGVGPDPIGWGVLSGPNPADPDDPAALGREMDGDLGEWDVAATAAQHDVTDFTSAAGGLRSGEHGLSGGGLQRRVCGHGGRPHGHAGPYRDAVPHGNSGADSHI